MIQLAKERQISVVLVGVPQLGLFLKPSALYKEIANEFSVPFEANTLTDLLKDKKMRSDAIHLNAQGYRVLAEALADLLKESGAI